MIDSTTTSPMLPFNVITREVLLKKHLWKPPKDFQKLHGNLTTPGKYCLKIQTFNISINSNPPPPQKKKKHKVSCIHIPTSSYPGYPIVPQPPCFALQITSQLRKPQEIQRAEGEPLGLGWFGWPDSQLVSWSVSWLVWFGFGLVLVWFCWRLTGKKNDKSMRRYSGNMFLKIWMFTLRDKIIDVHIIWIITILR